MTGGSVKLRRKAQAQKGQGGALLFLLGLGVSPTSKAEPPQAVKRGTGCPKGYPVPLLA